MASPVPIALIVGCEAASRSAVAHVVAHRGHHVIEAAAPSVAPAVLTGPTPVDVVLIDDTEGTCDSLAWMTSVRRLSPRSRIVLITGRKPQVLAMAGHLGVEDIVDKPPLDVVRLGLALRRRDVQGRAGVGDDCRTSWIVACQSAAMRPVLEVAARGGARDSKVLITGETGVGKEIIARLVHGWSRRALQPFVAVNCAGMPETLLESELFGHVKGSFTGAFRDSPGKLQLAHSGTFFLDEIGEMTPRMQGLLLRFLDTGELQPVGDTGTRCVNVRVIAATHRDLPELVREGRFREDLLYRIRVLHLHVPPLRERRDDIRPLLHHFIRQLHPVLELTEAAWQWLEEYRWPGNVRELRNVVEQLAALTDATPIDVDDVVRICHPSMAPAVGPFKDRRRRLAEDLFDRIRSGEVSFWTETRDRLLNRDIIRQDVRDLVALGLAQTGGSYRGLLRLFRMPASDYRRLLNFLDRHDCSVDFRPFRQATGSAGTELASDEPE